MRFPVLAGKCVFGFGGKMCFSGLAEKCCFTGLAEKCVFMKMCVLRFSRKTAFCCSGGKVFFSFCGKMHFFGSGGNIYMQKRNLRFENNIMIIKGYFCHLSFWTELLTFIWVRIWDEFLKTNIDLHLHPDGSSGWANEHHLTLLMFLNILLSLFFCKRDYQSFYYQN